MSTNLTEVIESAITDGAELVPWAEPNGAVLGDVPTENACLRALGNPVPPELAFGIPLLKCPDPDLPTAPLLSVLVNYKPTSAAECDRCHFKGLTSGRLLVPMGAVVVAVHLCRLCVPKLASQYPNLCWD